MNPVLPSRCAGSSIRSTAPRTISAVNDWSQCQPSQPVRCAPLTSNTVNVLLFRSAGPQIKFIRYGLSLTFSLAVAEGRGSPKQRLRRKCASADVTAPRKSTIPASIQTRRIASATASLIGCSRSSPMISAPNGANGLTTNVMSALRTFVIHPAHETLQRKEAVVRQSRFHAAGHSELDDPLHAHRGKRIAQRSLARARIDADRLRCDIGLVHRTREIFDRDDVDDAAVGMEIDRLLGANHHTPALVSTPDAVVRLHAAQSLDLLAQLGRQRIAARRSVLTLDAQP